MWKFLSFLMLAFSGLLLSQKKNIFDVARNGTVEEMTIILDKDSSIINSTNEMSFSPLILACYRGNVEVAKLLMERGADINYLSSEGTALAALSINYNKELVEKILNKGADTNIKDGHGNTPLLWAVKSGKKELAEILLKNGANPNIKDEQGVSAFEHAINTNNLEMINLLKSK